MYLSRAYYIYNIYSHNIIRKAYAISLSQTLELQTIQKSALHVMIVSFQ